MTEIIIKYSVTDASLAELREQYAVVPTVTDSKSLKSLKADITVVRSLRGDIEATRKDLKRDALEYGRRVDAEAKRITGELLKIEEPMKAEQKRYEDAVAAEKAEKARLEAERIRVINERIDVIAAIPAQLVSSPSHDIEMELEALDQWDDFDYQEFLMRYEAVLKKTRSTLLMMHGDAVEREYQAAKLAEEARLAEIERKRAKEERRRLAAKKAEEAEQSARREVEAERERQKLAAEREEFERLQKIADEKRADEEQRLDLKRAQIRAELELQQKAAEPEPDPWTEPLSEMEELDVITITRAEYDALIADQKKLIALESAGVDNWEGYEAAMEALNESR